MLEKSKWGARDGVGMVEIENTSTPFHAWVILSVALFAVSSAGAVFEMIEDIAPVTKAAWRLQATALVLFPPFVMQYSKADSELRSQWSSKLGLLTLSGIFLCPGLEIVVQPSLCYRFSGLPSLYLLLLMLMMH